MRDGGVRTHTAFGYSYPTRLAKATTRKGYPMRRLTLLPPKTSTISVIASNKALLKLLACVGSAIFISSCVSADLGLLSNKARSIQIGISSDQVEKILGRPQRTFRHPTLSNITYDHHCIYGVMNDDDVGLFYYKDKLYKKIYGVTASSSYSGVYEASKLGSCDNAIRVSWNNVQLPQEYLKEKRLAEQRESEIQRQKALKQAEQLALKNQREERIKTQEYFIDGLKITLIHDTNTNCTSGSDYQIRVSGAIGPDSSFALDELLRRSPNCLNENSEIKSRTAVVLESLGGLLRDGYLMGRALRRYEVKTTISNNSLCASSCAIAYLGGVERVMDNESNIMFHSPYLPGMNALGERIADCNVGSETTIELLNYYQEMTSPDQGKRLFDRTMSYCSADDGWVLKGSAAAELFGVATQI